MDLTNIEILILLAIDVASISMVFFIFRWARTALDRMKAQLVDMLSGETEESVAIVEKLGHTIYQKLYRYFNLKIPNDLPTASEDYDQNVPAPIQHMMSSVQRQSGLDPVVGAAKAIGIPDDVLKYLPLIQKYLGAQKSQGTTNENLNTGEYW